MILIHWKTMETDNEIAALQKFPYTGPYMGSS